MRDYESDAPSLAQSDPNPRSFYLDDFEGRQSMLKSLQVNHKELGAEIESNRKMWKERLDNCKMQATLLRQQAEVIDSMAKMITLHLAGQLDVEDDEKSDRF